MPSYQVGDICFSSSLAAAQAMAAREVGKIVQIGNASYVVDSPAQTGNSITYVFSNVSGLSSFTTIQTVSPLPCGLLDTSDGLIIAWGIAIAWIVTAGVLFLRKGIHE